MDTIFAQASAPGKAGVSVIRISGPRAWDAARQLCGSVPPARRTGVRPIRDADGALIDKALVLTFEDGASFTGEPVVELQTHGSISITRAVLDVLGTVEGLRLAKPGEFTRRSMDSGRLDLTQVEALGDLIEAETEAQRKQAMRMFQGAFGQRVGVWRERLVQAASYLEAVIDFSDEDVPESVSSDVRDILLSVKKDLTDQLEGFNAAERIRTGFEVAIIGAPNVGKSSLLNALAKRDVALTSEIAGTTRDIIEVRMDLGGYAVTLLDTAGLRDTSDEIEAMGVARAKARAEAADLRVLLHDGHPVEFDLRDGDLSYRSKLDLVDSQFSGSGISAVSGAGVDLLLTDIKTALEGKVSSAGLATHQRHRIALSSALERIDDVLLGLPDENYDLAAEDLRGALHALESLIGYVGVEAILDGVFSNFCIGK